MYNPPNKQTYVEEMYKPLSKPLYNIQPVT